MHRLYAVRHDVPGCGHYRLSYTTKEAARMTHIEWIEMGFLAGSPEFEYRCFAIVVAGSKGRDDDGFDEGQ
jgi:hypothetical protein